MQWEHKWNPKDKQWEPNVNPKEMHRVPNGMSTEMHVESIGNPEMLPNEKHPRSKGEQVCKELHGRGCATCISNLT